MKAAQSIACLGAVIAQEGFDLEKVQRIRLAIRIDKLTVLIELRSVGLKEIHRARG
jgi:hypothetical protein